MPRRSEAGGTVTTTAESALANAIRQSRQRAGLSHAQLAAHIGYSRQYVSVAERAGKGLASAGLVASIDAALGLDGELIVLQRRAAAERSNRRWPQAAKTSTSSEGPHSASLAVDWTGALPVPSVVAVLGPSQTLVALADMTTP